MTNRELMAKALEEQKKKKNPPKPPPTPVKAFKVGEKPPKKQRSKESREARAKTRGRLPAGCRFELEWNHEKQNWKGRLSFTEGDGLYTRNIFHEAPGVFQLLEELDIIFWERVAKEKGGG